MIYVFLADGFEETEALTTVDILRRAKFPVKTVGIGKKEIEGSHGITVLADVSSLEADLSDMDGVILPGGLPGTTNLEKDEFVLSAVREAFSQGMLTAAICAAPSVLGHLGILKGKKATCYPGFEDELLGAEYIKAPAVTDGNVVTSSGAGAVFEFGFAIVNFLSGNTKISNELRESMQCAQ